MFAEYIYTFQTLIVLSFLYNDSRDNVIINYKCNIIKYNQESVTECVLTSNVPVSGQHSLSVDISS